MSVIFHPKKNNGQNNFINSDIWELRDNEEQLEDHLDSFDSFLDYVFENLTLNAKRNSLVEKSLNCLNSLPGGRSYTIPDFDVEMNRAIYKGSRFVYGSLYNFIIALTKNNELKNRAHYLELIKTILSVKEHIKDTAILEDYSHLLTIYSELDNSETIQSCLIAAVLYEVSNKNNQRFSDNLSIDSAYTENKDWLLVITYCLACLSSYFYLLLHAKNKQFTTEKLSAYTHLVETHRLLILDTSPKILEDRKALSTYRDSLNKLNPDANPIVKKKIMDELERLYKLNIEIDGLSIKKQFVANAMEKVNKIANDNDYPNWSFGSVQARLKEIRTDYKTKNSQS